jgi:hypothetical protein
MPETFTIKPTSEWTGSPSCQSYEMKTSFGLLWIHDLNKRGIWSVYLRGTWCMNIDTFSHDEAKATALAWFNKCLKESLSPCPAISEAVEAWRPFSTAPETGDPILVYREDAGVFTARYVAVECDDVVHGVTMHEVSDCIWIDENGDDRRFADPLDAVPVLPQTPRCDMKERIPNPTVVLSNTDLLKAVEEWLAKYRPGVIPSGVWKTLWRSEPSEQTITATVEWIGPVPQEAKSDVAATKRPRKGK